MDDSHEEEGVEPVLLENGEFVSATATGHEALQHILGNLLPVRKLYVLKLSRNTREDSWHRIFYFSFVQQIS